jgi:hypothetical protein
MTPEEYVRDCCNPAEPPGAQFCQVSEYATGQGWSKEQIQEAWVRIMDLHDANAVIFPFPKTPRYI